MLNLPAPYQYQLACEEWQKKLSLDSSPRIYKGLGAAVGEIVLGLAQFLPHKRSVAWLKGQTPWMELATSYFFREGYECNSVAWGQMSSAQSFVEGLKKDTALVIFSEDHALTDEFFDFDLLDQLLNDKKIFSIRLSHRSHLLASATKKKLNSFSVRICQMNSDFAYAQFGDRYRVPASICATQSFQLPVCEHVETAASEIQEFESQLPPGFFKFNLSSNRLFTHSLIYNPKMGGDFLVHQIKSMSLETLHECSFDGFKTYNSWWDPLPNSDFLRGSLIVKAQQIKVLKPRQQLIKELSLVATKS